MQLLNNLTNINRPLLFNKIILILHFYILMTARYKDDSFHMLETFNRTKRVHNPLNSSMHKTQNIKGKTGKTWNAQHMSNFLNQSNYSNWQSACTSTKNGKEKRSNRYSFTQDYFFKTSKDNKNASIIGYSHVNPLVSLAQTNPHNVQTLKKYLQNESPERYTKEKPPMVKDGSFLFQGNSVKYQRTDPLTLQYVKNKSPSGFDKQRLKWLIQKRHPHGLTGIQHSECPQRLFYKQYQKQIIHKREGHMSQRSHLIDKDWKSKGRVNENYKEQYGFQKGVLIQQRKFRNDDSHGFNIITNCQNRK